MKFFDVLVDIQIFAFGVMAALGFMTLSQLAEEVEELRHRIDRLGDEKEDSGYDTVH